MNGVDQCLFEVTHECDRPVENAETFRVGKVLDKAQELGVCLFVLSFHQTEEDQEREIVSHRRVENVQL